MIPSLETLDWGGFLARQPLPPVSPSVLEKLCRHSILITGAGGSIASALALRLAPYSPRLVLLESSESHLFNLQREWSEIVTARTSESSPTFLLGSTADSTLLEEIFSVHAPRLIFHAAAFKHVPLLEEQPLAAIANNIYGTLSLVTAASAHHARVVLLSTDKAVEPASVMGATKRVAENIVLDAGGIVLRLGNVLASRDSVAELFARQIAAGGPLSVTDPAARRYFLTRDEAVDLLLCAATEHDPPLLLAPNLSATQYIADLAQFMASHLAPNRNIPVHFSSPRAGDKESEKLWSSAEQVRPAIMRGLLSIDSPRLTTGQPQSLLATLRGGLDARDIAVTLDSLCALVPDYTPSPTVLALREKATSQVQHE